MVENLTFWARLKRAHGDLATRGALEAFAMDHLAGVPARFLSAGQRRRVSLARILAAPAPLWLLDEPATDLDSAAANSLQTAVARHRADGGMVVVATHADLGLDGAARLHLTAFAAARGAGW